MKTKGQNNIKFLQHKFFKILGLIGFAFFLLCLWYGGTIGSTKEIYPAKDITFICYSQPGGSYDLTARTSAPFLTKALREVSPGAKGGTIQVKNMTGGSGAKAAYYLFYDAKPDGYTIGDLNRASFYKFMMGKDRLPFDVRDFTYLYSLSTVNRVLISGKRSGITTWEEMLNRSKKESLRWAVSSKAGSEHLDTIYVLETLGIKNAQISIWGSTSQAESALIRGDADVHVVSYEFLEPLIAAKEIFVLVSFTKQRIRPNIPCIAEKGFGQIADYVGGIGGKMVIAPPKLDPEIKNILIAAAKKMVADPEFIKVCNQSGMELTPLFDKDLVERVNKDVEFYKKMDPIYKKHGIK